MLLWNNVGMAWCCSKALMPSSVLTPEITFNCASPINMWHLKHFSSFH